MINPWNAGLRHGVAVAALMTASIAALPARANDSGLLDEVVVTAQKREQRVQDVGLSITAFGAKQIHDLGIDTTEDLGKYAPGLSIVDGYGGAPIVTTVTIRGVNQQDFSQQSEPPNSVYVDGAYVSFAGGVGASMFDVDRVEILRGPQGTLYGRNATGGLINIISRKPTDQFDAYAGVTLGSYNQRKLDAAIGGPLSDSIDARLAVQTNKFDGWWKNLQTNTGEYGMDNSSVRAQLLFKVTDDLQVLLNVHGTRDKPVAAGAYTWRASHIVNGHEVWLGPNEINTSCPAITGLTGLPGSDCLDYIEPSTDPRSGHSDFVGYFERTVEGATATVTWASHGLSFTSITDYYRNKSSYGEDSDATPILFGNSTQWQNVHQFSQEFRMAQSEGRFRWTAGLYYLDISGDYNQAFLSPIWYGLDNIQATYFQTTKSASAFAQVEYDLAPTWTIIAGARYVHDQKATGAELDCAGGGCGPFFGIGAVTTYPDVSRTDPEHFAGKLQLEWRPIHDVLAYAGINRGLKGGGFNVAPFLLASAGITQYEPEKLTDYEGGVKSTLLGGRAVLNAAAFYYDYKNYQAFQNVFFTQRIFNADATFHGVELDGMLNLGDGWRFQAAGAWLTARAKNINVGSGLQLDLRAPKEALKNWS